MKKIVSIILALMYFSLSTSASINLHYCSGDLKAIDVNSEQNCCCSSEIGASCCQNETIVLKIEIDQKLNVNQNKLPKRIEIESELFETFIAEERLLNENFVEITFIKPPNKEPIWLLNCAFTYYG